MSKVWIERLGYGQGEGEKVLVLNRKEIELIIEDLEDSEIITAAYNGWNYGFKSGYATLNLETGELESDSLGQGESYQACDNTYIILYKIDQNDECYEDEDECDEDEDIIDIIEYGFKLDWQNIKIQLDEFYGKDEK
jgi:hypothetical protein